MFDRLSERIALGRREMEIFYRKIFLSGQRLNRTETVAKYVLTAYRTNKRNEIGFKCAALVYNTCFAIVPILALILIVTDGLGVGHALDRLTTFVLPDTPDFIKVFLETARTMSVETTSGVVTFISILFLLWSIWTLMDSVHTVFGDIWKNQIRPDQNRSWTARIISRLSLLVFSPFIIIVMYAGATEITVIESYLVRKIGVPFFFKGVNFLVMYGGTAFVFTMMYKFIPSVKVGLKNAVTSALAASFVFVIYQLFYILVQSQVSNYNIVYGTIAALPLFLVWAYYSWECIIKGAVLCHTLEYPKEYDIMEVVTNPSDSKITVDRIVHDIFSLSLDKAEVLRGKVSGKTILKQTRKRKKS